MKLRKVHQLHHCLSFFLQANSPGRNKSATKENFDSRQITYNFKRIFEQMIVSLAKKCIKRMLSNGCADVLCLKLISNIYYSSLVTTIYNLWHSAFVRSESFIPSIAKTYFVNFLQYRKENLMLPFVNVAWPVLGRLFILA